MRSLMLGLFMICGVVLVPIRIAGDCGPLSTFQGYTFINPYIVSLDPKIAGFFLDLGL